MDFRDYKRLTDKLDHVHEVLHKLVELTIVLTNKVDVMAKSQTELTAQVKTIGEAIAKIGTESTALLKKVAEIQTTIENGPDVTPELQAAVDAVAAQAKVVDDLVPDAPVV